MRLVFNFNNGYVEPVNLSSIEGVPCVWWLSVFFLVNGQWIPGHVVEPTGWAPRSYVTEAECDERKRFAEKQCVDWPLRYKAVWFCSKDKPITSLPEEARTSPCPWPTH